MTNPKPSLQELAARLVSEAQNLQGWNEEEVRAQRVFNDARRARVAAQNTLNAVRNDLNKAIDGV